MKSLPPRSDSSSGPPDSEGYTDFQSLKAELPQLTAGVVDRLVKKAPAATDFASLKKTGADSRREFQRRTTTDYLVNVVTPFMIFVMVSSVVFFLLDVRYIYLALDKIDRIAQMYETSLRWVAFMLVMGIVALNRLIARDGKEESILYTLGLVLAIGFYTFSTTGQVGSMARNFMNEPYLATIFNMGVVALLWWITNRLTHECCVDRDLSAGDIGILTGTAQRFHAAVDMAKGLKPTPRKEEPLIPVMELNAADPTEWKAPEKAKAAPAIAATKRLSNRHPGISVFYASIPVMIIFVLGQWVMQHADLDTRVRANMFIAAYTVAALMLLMLSSLGSLREYFRERNIRIPGGIGPFWIGLGTAMVVIVILAATRMPMPTLPAFSEIPQQAAYDQINTSKGDESDSSSTSKDSKSQEQQESSKKPQKSDSKPTPPDKSQAPKPKPKPPKPKTTEEALAVRFPNIARSFEWMQKAVMVGMILFGIYAALRILAMLAVGLAGKTHRNARWLSRLFRALDRFLQRLTRLPRLPTLHLPQRVDRSVAQSIQYHNPLADPAMSRTMTANEIIEYSYSAMCALASDLAVPRRLDQTPYEFIRTFPETLITLRDDAVKLTNLYVLSAYSNLALDQRNLDVVRAFWRCYEKVRGSVVR